MYQDQIFVLIKNVTSSVMQNADDIGIKLQNFTYQTHFNLIYDEVLIDEITSDEYPKLNNLNFILKEE